MSLEILPSQITVTGKQSVCFQVLRDGKAVPVPETSWKLTGVGTSAGGVYTSPQVGWVGKRAVMTAELEEGSVSAEIDISPAHVWIGTIWAYLVLVALLCGWGIYQIRPTDNTKVPLVAGPAMVTLKQGDSQTFLASGTVAWPGISGGKVEAKEGAGSTRIYRAEGARVGDNADLVVAETQDVSLKLTPGFVQLSAGEKLAFQGLFSGPAGAQAPALQFDVVGVGKGKISPKGEYVAPAQVNEAAVDVVRVSTQTPASVAEARVLLVPAAAAAVSGTAVLILLAALCGALGSILHGMNSLASYVGAKQFLSSWGVYYLARPFVGGLLGPLMFLVFRVRLVDSPQNLNASDWLSVAALAGVSGLFADMAMLKLKQVVHVVFGVPQDDRPHKLDAEKTEQAEKGAEGRTGAAAASAAAASAGAASAGAGAASAGASAADAKEALSIASVLPKEVTKGAPQALAITGAGFGAEAKVEVNGAAREGKPVSSTEMELPLEAADVAETGELKIVVVLGDQKSNEVQVSIVEPAGEAMGAAAGGKE